MISHKTKKYKSAFATKYNCDKLVYFEEFTDINQAIKREKQLKAGNRKIRPPRKTPPMASLIQGLGCFLKRDG